jgi:hypothetical protein
VANDPYTPERAPIIPQNPVRSRPPRLPPHLVALFESSKARFGKKPLSIKHLLSPPSLPERARDPHSRDAMLFGRFSLRRTANIHRRFMRTEMAKLIPPLEIRYQYRSLPLTAPERADNEANHARTVAVDHDSPADLLMAGARVQPIGFESTTIFREVEAFARPVPRPIPRRQRRSEGVISKTPSDLKTFPLPVSPSVGGRSLTCESSSMSGIGRCAWMALRRNPRFLRRRFAEILAETPILHHITPPSSESAWKCSSSSRSEKSIDPTTPSSTKSFRSNWAVSISQLALSSYSQAVGNGVLIGCSDRAWIQRAHSK